MSELVNVRPLGVGTEQHSEYQHQREGSGECGQKQKPERMSFFHGGSTIENGEKPVLAVQLSVMTTCRRETLGISASFSMICIIFAAFINGPQIASYPIIDD